MSPTRKTSGGRHSEGSNSSRGTASSAGAGLTRPAGKDAQKHRDFENVGQDCGAISISEKSKLLRAKRNREAAHRSRTKNKIRQNILEDETKKQLKLNEELTNLMDALLVGTSPPQASGYASRGGKGRDRG